MKEERKKETNKERKKETYGKKERKKLFVKDFLQIKNAEFSLKPIVW